MIVFMFFFLMTVGKNFWFDWLINILKKLRIYKVIEQFGIFFLVEYIHNFCQKQKISK